MWKRVLMGGAMATVVVVALTSSLLVLDVVSAPDLRDALGKTLLIIGIVTTAILLLFAAVKLGMGPRKAGAEQAPPPTS